MTIDKIITENIVRRVLSVARPESIILFGSVATEQMNPDSGIEFPKTHDKEVPDAGFSDH